VLPVYTEHIYKFDGGKDRKGIFQMKKNKLGILLAAALTFGLMSISCATTKTGTDAGRYDYTSPEDQDAVIVVGSGSYNVCITKFDDDVVSWVGGQGTVDPFDMLIHGKDGSFRIRIPAGMHTVTGGQANAQRPGELLFTTSTKYNFLAGKVYNIDIENRNFRIIERSDVLSN
jgi:hypothetical protein